MTFEISFIFGMRFNEFSFLEQNRSFIIEQKDKKVENEHKHGVVAKVMGKFKKLFFKFCILKENSSAMK